MADNKRDDILAATIEVLTLGGEPKVTTIAERAGVAPALLYRYFTDQDGLLAAAYTEIARGYVGGDIDHLNAIRHLPKAAMREALSEQWVEILGPRRADKRRARLEALGQFRVNPVLREEDALDVVGVRRHTERIIDILGMHDSADADDIGSLCVLAMSVPLGFTALGGDYLSPSEKSKMAEAMAAVIINWLEERGFEFAP